MYIEKITINNFRIYYGRNSISLVLVPHKNVSIISGDNGYGKTTFLTALVWCLYGKQMLEVDQFYKDRILASGGYKRYLASSINKRARADGETEFSVSIDLRNVELPGVYCNSMQITRTYDIGKSNDVLKIEMDNGVSELVDDVGQQVFIHDFILPKEIAKFFFFDAEKIVKIAEIKTNQDKKLLGQAYLEVLGIKKYENLKSSLTDLRLRFKKDSANDIEKATFQDLSKEINQLKRSITQNELKKDKLLNLKSKLKIQSDSLYEKLLREGNTLTISDIHELQDEKSRLLESRKTLLSEFRELFEYAPFAILGNLLTKIENQLNVEEKYNRAFGDEKILRTKIDTIISELKHDTSVLPRKFGSKIKDYYVSKVQKLLNTYLIEINDEVVSDNIAILHNFTDEERNIFKAILTNLKNSYKEKIKELNRALMLNKAAYSDISRKLSKVESIETDELIRNYREAKERIDKRINDTEENILELSHKIGSSENNLSSKQRVFDEIAKKIRVSEKYREKDQLVSQIIDELDTFINRIKFEKKHSLEDRILSNLEMLMHKKDFIRKVVVDVSRDILDIRLISIRNEEIHKDDLSKGEQQLYATSILKALVEESGIDFPVFIDSPLQKFDDKHSRNIITGFYPHISGQVVILPLLNKELTEEEYKQLFNYVGSTFIIDNFNENSSGFREVNPEELFNNGTKVNSVLINA